MCGCPGRLCAVPARHGGRVIRTWRHITRRVAALLLLSACALAALSAPASATSSPNVHVPSALLMSMDGTVLWSHNPNAPRRVASTIKMLNALVVMDHAKLDDVVVVPKQASSIDDGGVGLRTGQKLTVRQLLNIMLVHSANDAAEALAIHVGGSEKTFVAMMNDKAKSLGLKHTHAMDPHGLGKHETCTANDLSVLARNVMANKVLRGIVRQTHVMVPRGNGRSEEYGTTDALLGVYRGMEGVKTGYTDPAGYVFVGAAKRGDVELLGVIMGADSNAARFSDMRTLLNWGFATYHDPPATRLVSLSGPIGVVLVSEGVEPTVTVRASTVATCMVVQGADITTRVVLPQSVRAPVAWGQRIGTLEVCRAGATIATVALVAERNVAAPPKADPSALRLAHPTSPTPLPWWQRAFGAWAGTWRRLLAGIVRTGPAAP